MADLIEILGLDALESAVQNLGEKLAVVTASDSSEAVQILQEQNNQLALRLEKQEKSRQKMTDILDETIGQVEKILTAKQGA